MIRGSRVARYIIILVVAVGILIWGYWAGWVESGVKQPVAFPHKTHIALSLTCTTCHQGAEKNVVAGRPPTALCLGCHAGADTQSPEIKKLQAYGENGQEIPWRRVWRLPSHVFFPHSAHVAAQVSCQTCHGPMETLDRPPERPLKKLTMDDCIDCHAQRKEQNAVQPTRVAAQRSASDCIVCHR